MSESTNLAMTNLQRPEISIFVPVNNEEESIPILYQELSEVLTSMGREYEIIFVDDGSTDNSLAILKDLRKTDKRLKIVSFTKNFGLTPAMSAGIDAARGKIIVGIDGDLEQDPHDIPVLIAKLEEGYDLVSGWRHNKWKNGLRSLMMRRIPTEVANFLIRLLTGVTLRDNSSTLKAYRSEMIKPVKLYGEMHRFIPVLAGVAGARMAEVKVNFRQRRFGSTHYGLSRAFRVLLDLILLKFLQQYSTQPLRIFGGIGVLLSGFGTTLLSYLVVIRLFFNEAIADRPLLLMSVLLVLLGVQLIVMGLLGELVVRTYYESQNKPIYHIREKHL